MNLWIFGRSSKMKPQTTGTVWVLGLKLLPTATDGLVWSAVKTFGTPRKSKTTAPLQLSALQAIPLENRYKLLNHDRDNAITSNNSNGNAIDKAYTYQATYTLH